MELSQEQKDQPKGPKIKQRNQAVSAVHGNVYQLKLLMLFMYRGVSLGYSFRLGTEIEEADKFDDLVFEYTKDNKKMYRLLQAKHKLDESKKITAHNLFKEKNGDYNLIKYFHSYQFSKNSSMFKDGSIKDVIICTNIDFDFENLKRERITVEEIKDKDDILVTIDGRKQPKRFKLSQDLATSDKMNEFSTDEVKDFIDHLVFAVKQPNEEELGLIIKEELGKGFDFDLKAKEDVYNKLFITMLDWFKNKESDRYFSSEEGRKFFEEAKRGMPIWFDVRDPVESFVGRLEQLDNLHRMLQSGDTTLISQAVSISGLGGIGKSELAKIYINEHSQDYDDRVIWINAENYQTLSESFRRLACDKLGMCTKNPNGEKKEMKSIVEDVYNFFSHGKSLFVFDNAEKYRSENEYDCGIDTFLLSRPPSNKNRPCILITSRNQKWPKNIKVVTLDTFTEEETIEFIKKSLGIQNDAQDEEIKEMSKELQYFPLALQQAVSYIRVQDEKMKNVRSAFKISNYLQMFREKTEKLLDFQFPEDSDNEYTKTTYVTWNVTLDALEQKENGRDALEILNIISYLTPENIPTQLLLSYISNEETLGSAIELLKQYSIVKSYLGKLSIHRLVQHVTRMKLEKEKSEVEILKNILISLIKADVDSETVDHAISVWNYSSKYSELVEEYFSVSFVISKELVHSYRYEEAHLFGLTSFALLTSKNPVNAYYLSTTLSNISYALKLQGKYDTALKVLLELLSLNDIVFGRSDRHTLKTKKDIALMFSELGRYNEALEYHQEILNDFKIILGENHPDTLEIKFSIANTLYILCKFDEALQIWQELYDIKAPILGENHPETLNIKIGIASILAGKGNYKEALEMSQNIYCSEAANLNESPPDILHTQKIKAGFLVGQGKFNDALQTFQEVLSVEKVRLGEEHPDYLHTCSQIGEILRRQSKYYEALDIFRDILKKQENILGSEHLHILTIKNNEAATLLELGKHSDALRIFQEILSKQKVILGYDHINTLQTANNIAEVFSSLGENGKALQHLQETLGIIKGLLGDNHPDTLMVKHNIGTVLYKKKEYDKAIVIFKEVFSLSKKLYPDHPITFLVNSNLATALSNQGEKYKALKMCKELYASQESVLGKEHYCTMRTKFNIATAILEQGKLNEAVEILLEVVEKYRIILGTDHKETLEASNLLESLKIAASRFIFAARDKDLNIIKDCVNLGYVNVKDNNGKSLLHHAIKKGNLDIFNILIQSKADATRACNKGKTVLHVATAKGFKEVVKNVLQHVHRSKLNAFVDAEITSDGTTSLHIAVQSGFIGIVIALLKHGATYNIKNKAGETPLELSKNRGVTKLLKLIAELFEDAQNGNKPIVNKLKAVKPDKFPAVVNARNNEGHTLLQVAIVNEHKDIARELLHLL